jgi:AcrR family transcriptional regulator
VGRPRTDIRQRLLLAARARFLEDGVDGASLRTIARTAKTNVGMIYYYYPTKDSLFLAVVEEVYAKLLADLRAILETLEPIDQRLRRAYVRIGRAHDDEIDVLRIVVREAIVASPRFRLVLARFGRGHVAALFTALAGAQSTGEVDPALPLPLVVITALAMGGVPQVARRIARGALPFDLPPPELLADAAVRVLFGGIGPRKSRSARSPRSREARAVHRGTPQRSSRTRRSERGG